MKGIVAIAAVISCLCVVASAQSCDDQATQLASCSGRLAVATLTGATGSFCDDCGNSLYRYYRDCISGGDVTPVTNGEFNINCNSNSFHFY